MGRVIYICTTCMCACVYLVNSSRENSRFCFPLYMYSINSHYGGIETIFHTKCLNFPTMALLPSEFASTIRICIPLDTTMQRMLYYAIYAV